MNSKKPFGFIGGAIMLVFGLFLGLVNYLSITFSDYYFPKIFIAAGAFIGLGIGMFILPGSKVSDETPSDKKVKVWWSTSPIWQRIIWIISGLIGLLLSLYALLQMDPNFLKV